MDEIQKHIAKRGKRSAISRRYHANDDEEAIATWKLNLGRIRRVFNVRFITSVRRSLTFRLQAELKVNARATGSGTHQDSTTNENAIGSGVANTHTVVPDIHCNKLKGREGAGGRNQVVSFARAPLVFG